MQYKVQDLEYSLSHWRHEKENLQTVKSEVDQLKASMQLLLLELKERNQEFRDYQMIVGQEKNALKDQLLQAKRAIIDLNKEIIRTAVSNEAIRQQEMASDDSDAEVHIVEQPEAPLQRPEPVMEEPIKRYAENTQQINRIKEFNNYLVEKERLLKYELTKSRAQSLGFEKLCEDFKVQIEELSRNMK